MRRRSSQESAAAFIALRANKTRRPYRTRRLIAARDLKESRLTINFARATVEELLDCVSARINDCIARDVEPDHITNVAWMMLDEALRGER